MYKRQELNGITNKKDAIEKMLGVLAKLGCGEKGVQYKMKDWAFNPPSAADCGENFAKATFFPPPD